MSIITAGNSFEDRLLKKLQPTAQKKKLARALQSISHGRRKQNSNSKKDSDPYYVTHINAYATPFGGGTNGECNSASANHGRNTGFLQATTNRGANDA